MHLWEGTPGIDKHRGGKENRREHRMVESCLRTTSSNVLAARRWGVTSDKCCSQITKSERTGIKLLDNGH